MASYQITTYRGISHIGARNSFPCGPFFATNTTTGTITQPDRIYVVLLNQYNTNTATVTVGSLEVWMSTDTGVTWAQQDSINSYPVGNLATGTAGLNRASSWFDPTNAVINIVYGADPLGTGPPVASTMGSFDCIHNTFGGTTTDGPTYNDGHLTFLQIAKRSTGELAVMSPFTTPGIAFHFYMTEFTGGTWGTSVLFNTTNTGTGGFNFFQRPVGICPGSSGRIHCFFNAYEGTDAFGMLKTVTFESGNTYGVEGSVGTNIDEGNCYPARPLFYPSSGTLIIAEYNGSSSDVNVFTAAEADVPTFSFTSAGIVESDPENFSVSAQINGTTTEVYEVVGPNYTTLQQGTNTGGGWSNGSIYVTLGGDFNFGNLDVGIVSGTSAVVLDEGTSSDFSDGHTIILFPSFTPPAAPIGLVLGPLNLTY